MYSGHLSQGNTQIILYGDGLGGVSEIQKVPSEVVPFNVLADTFDAGGVPDLAVLNIESAQIRVFTQDSSGAFSEKTVLSGGQDSFSLASSDFNKDGKTDIVVGTRTSSTSGKLVVYFQQ